MHTPPPLPHQVLRVHGPVQACSTLVLDSPHSGTQMPADFGSVCSDSELRDGEDCFIDELYLPAAASGVPLLAAQFPRTYLDANRHAGDIDLELLAEPWPYGWVPSGKAAIGKALLWRTLDNGRPLYARKLSVAEVRHRIEHYHQPYHQTLQRLLDAAHSRYGVVHHINCHSMNPVAGVMGAGGAGVARADFVLGDRDGTTCAPEFTTFVREHLVALGYSVAVNDPFKGVELVRAYANPAQGRHSLQLEVNKRLYMDGQTLQKHAGFDQLQTHLQGLLRALQRAFAPLTRRPWPTPTLCTRQQPL
jgi:N-formylglutamate deformylase